jgi:DnaJ homolog subfamily C member 19
MTKLLLYAAIVAALYWLGRKALRSTGQMTPRDAAKLLDIAPDANADVINSAHRRIISKVHPDAGGTAELAARINQARDVLLKQNNQ